MKKNSRLKSFFAILLAVSMIFQQSSLTVLATDDTYVEDATATPTPSESEAEAYTTEGAEPVAEKQEEPQQMQETPAAEQAQEPTEAPAEQPTEAPAEQPTEAPVEQPTEAPAAAPTEAPVTEPTAAPAEVTEAPAAPETTATPAAEATATPTPEVSASPSETPMPTITPTPELTNQFQSNSGNVSATVLLQDDKLEINSTSFLIEEKDLDSEYVSELVDPAMNVWCESNGMTIIDAAVFDMHFNDNDGKEISNIESAVVNVGFANPILGSVAGNVYVLHIKDGVAFDVTGNVAQNSDGTVSGAVINTNGFSPFVLVKVTKENSVELTAKPSTKLNDFVTTVEIANGKYDANGKLILYPGSDFSFKLSFAETEGKQMDVEKNLEYEYPLALTPTGQNGTFEIVAKKGSDTYVVRGNTYEIVGNKIIFKLNKSDPNFQQIRDASNVSFDIDLKAKVNDDATGDKINFGDSVEKDVTFEENGVVNVVKTGTYDKAKGKFWYEVTVSATGTCKNVVVTDAITGTLLTYDDNLTANPVKDGVTEITNSNGFSYTIPRMIDGETIKLKYSASIDYAKLGKNDKEFTVDQTKNTVTAKVDNTPSGSDEKDFEHTTIAGSMSKSAIDNNTAGNKQTTTWKIVINPDANQYVGGSKVTDTLQQNANAKTEYSGTGLVVKIYDKQGNLIETKTPAWGDSDLQWNKENHWQYTLPTNGNKTPYKYEIEYTTETDVSQILDNVTIVNNAEDGNGGSVSGSTTATVTPGNKFEVSKSHANATENGVDWTVSIDIPERGFNQSFVVTDTLPGTWNGEWCSDQFIRESLKIELGNVRLVENRDYTLDYTANVRGARNQFKVTFINVNTLFPAGVDGRVLTLTYKTKPDTNWPEGEEHRNDVTVVGDGKNKNVSDSYKIVKHKLSKEATKNSKIEWENGLPCFKFDILLEGVDQDPTYIEDIFDKTLFKVNDDTTNVYLKAQLGAGDYSWDAQNAANGSSNGGDVSWTTTENGVQFKISNLAKKGEAYYSYYCIRYTLKVIDANALKKLEQLAASSEDHKYAIENTAKWDNSDSDNSYKYEIKPITKTVVEPSEGNNFVATFTIIVNPNKVKLNNGNPIRLDDHLTVSGNGKMKILPDTIDVQLDPTGGTYKKDYSEDRESFTLEIPDECKATITYQAKAYGNKGSTITYSNDATIIGGYDASVDNKNVTITSSASGTSEVFMYKIVKRDAVTKERLEAAKFQLYEVTETGEKELYDKSKNNAPVTFTTDSNGEAVIEGKDETVYGWHLYEGRTYRLKEIEAPEGYEKAAPITFTVLSSNDQNIEAGQYGLFNGEDIDVYDAKAVEVNLDAKKILEGANLTADEFNFKLKPDENNKNDKNGEQNKKNDGNGKITFDKLTFSKAGTYKYTITEVAGSDGTITYDGAVYEVIITVSENENGGLIVNKTINKKAGNDVQDNVSEITFENTYKEPTPAEYQFGVEKLLTGVDNTDTEYTFELREGENKLDTVKVKGKGSKTFKKLTYNEEGTYTYTVKETSIAPAADAHGSWVYDTSEHEVKVTVRYNADTNAYEIEQVTGLDSAKNVKITNSYTEKTPSPAEYQFGVEKLLTGVDNTDTEYTFELREGENKLDTVKVKGKGSKTFKKLTYNEEGTYTYTVKETSIAPAADAHGSWVYDTSEHEVKVTVRYNADTNAYEIEQVTGLDSAKNVKITNSYTEKTPSPAEYQFGVEKLLTGVDNTDTEYTFELREGENKLDTVKVKGKGSKTFKKLTYNEEGTYTYTVKETSIAPAADAHGSWVYDTSEHEVKVTVRYNADTNAYEIEQVTGLDSAKNVKITNSYTEKTPSPAEYQFGVEKLLTGVDNTDTEYTFELREGENKLDTVKVKGKGSKTFKKLTYNEEGTYTYTVKETSIAPAADAHGSWVYDTSEHEVKVTVRYNADTNAYEIEQVTGLDSAKNVKITNSYTEKTPSPAEYQFGVEKLLTGVDNTDTEYTFELREGENKLDTVKVKGKGSKTFKKLTYNEEGTYTYTVKETSIAPAADAHGSWVYDTSEHEVKVTVRYNADTNAYEIEQVTGLDSAKNVKITNSYTEKTPSPAEYQFGVEKLLTGVDNTDTEYTFELREGENKLDTVKVKGKGSKTFKKLTYNEEGTYTYTVKETSIAPAADAHGSWVYDTSEHEVKVTVRYNADTNAYEIEQVTGLDSAKNVKITNSYTEKTPSPAEYQFGVEKLLTGVDNTDTEYTFELREGENKLDTVKVKGKGSKTFKKLTYNEEGTYTYTVKETSIAPAADAHGSWVYDNSEHKVTVTVRYDEDANAYVISNVTGLDTVQNVEITNQFIPSVAIALTAQKSMKVSSDSLGIFEFELSGDNIETQTVTNNEAGAITFAPIHYNLSDVGNTYTYTVREKAPSTEVQYGTDGIKYVYDTNVYTVKVKVEDNGDGTLKLTKTVKIGEKDYTDPEMKFVNDTTKATITKVDAFGNPLSGVELEVRDKNNEMVDSWTTSTKDNPHVITGKLILGETYKLVEKSAPAGYTLADPVEFTVSENDIDNKVEMKNTYSASGSLNLTAKKTLTTTETPLVAGQFTFELRDKDGTVLQTKTNDADGNVTFDEIKYSLVKDNTDKKVDNTGEYQYTVNEVKGDAAGYTYDDTIYTINVTVTDAGNGTLTVTPVIHSSKATSEDASVTGMEFTNTYTTSGQIALGATKTLEGQTLEAEQFSFQATEMDADGKAVENGYSETVKNADGGAITFPIITYKESGTHYYQITEVKDEKPAYQYDESKYVVKVDVTDDNAGKLTAKVTSVTKNGEPVKSEDLTGAVTFTNTYSASADLELKAQKSMKVEAEQLGTFEFELKDTDGKVIETVKNDEKGAISFSKLSYTEKDAGKTFTYTVNEKLPSEADTYVYDKTVYTVTVNVEDNRDGTLKLTTKVNGEDYTETAMKFVNDTTKVTISKVDDTTLKALAGAKLQVVGDQDKVVEEWTSDGTPHVITAKLVLGKTYKLVEAEAPSGYEIAEPITFIVDADDTKNAVEMKDAMTKSKTAAIEITKELKLNDALAGAKDMTFYAALFADAECTIPASDVKALEFKNASSSTVTFTNLDLGRTYYVSETDVTGKAIDSGMTPDEKVYVPVYPQGQAITVTEDGAKSSITFENQFSEWPDGFYKIATLNVTKKLLGAEGNALESDEIFYAGIFDDKECTTLSTRTEKNILTLDLAGGSTVSESTQAVVIPDESFTLYVAETDAEGNLVGGTDGFRYAVTVENGNVLFDENNLNAEVIIINQEQPEATPTVTPEETITPTPTPGTSTGVKTGDDTPIGFYMALLFVAALAIEETTRRRRKKEQD